MSDLSWFRNRFPYTKLNDINLDWLLKRMKELSALVVSYADDIQRALTQSSTAITQSEAAVNSANNAVSIANNASATADAVSGIAEDARTIASAANNTAIHAETVANGIAETAQSALDTAQNAETIAGAAAQSAENAQSTAQNAVTVANGANTRADNAEQSALTAISTATAAQQIATDAAQDAETAQQAATAATRDAQTAQQEATAAAQDAETAQQAATAAAQDAQTAQQEATAAARDAQTAQQAATAAAHDAQTAQQAASTISINKADVITETNFGDVVYIPDGANDLPLESIVLQITPMRASGTPTPDSPLPISGRTGLCLTQAGTNLFDEDGADWKNGYFLNESGNESSSNSYKYCQTYFPIPSETAICVQYNKGFTSSAALTICWYDSNKNFISRSILIGATSTTGLKTGRATTPVGAKYYRMSLPRFDSTDIMVEVGSSASSYAEYAGKIVYIDWSTIAGTIYSGALEWLGNNRWKLDARPYYASYNGESLVGPWVSSMDVYTPGTTPTIGAQVVDIGGASIEYTLTILNSDIMTTLGVNYIFAECEPVSLAYRADTKLYIQKINAPADSDMIADSQIANGKYFIVGGNLYKSTTVIAENDTIIPGSNCIKTNLADALNSLI